MKNSSHSDILIIVPRYGQYAETAIMIPPWLAYVSSALKKAGYGVDVLNLNHHGGRYLKYWPQHEWPPPAGTS